MPDKNTVIFGVKKRMTISEVSNIVGVSVKTLTRLEKSGKTPKAKRDWRGWRVYNEEDLVKIKDFFETVFEVQ